MPLSNGFRKLGMETGMSKYVELRRTVHRTGPLRYVPLIEVDQHTGFRSVYAVTEPVRDQIIKNDSVENLDQLPVYSDTLFVDFDTYEGVEEFQETLVKLGVGFEVYNTGRRGAHFHITCTPMSGAHVPRSQRAWVEQHATGSWDATLYRHASLIRLPGTWHEKSPGAAKSVILVKPGALLDIPRSMSIKVEVKDSNTERTNPATFWSMMLKTKTEPGRTAHVFFLGALAAEAGVTYQTGLEAVKDWSQRFAVPIMADLSEVTRAFTNGYKRGTTK